MANPANSANAGWLNRHEGGLYLIVNPTCEQMGTYTVSISDGNWNTYTASGVVQPGNGSLTPEISTVTLHLVPSAGGTGWSFQWSVGAAVTGPFQPLSGETQPSLILPRDAADGYYQGIATRGAETAWVLVHFTSDSAWQSRKMDVVSTENAALDLTYTAASLPETWTYAWFFTDPQGIQETVISGQTGRELTLQNVGCGEVGTYRVQFNCGSASTGEARMVLTKQGCQ